MQLYYRKWYRLIFMVYICCSKGIIRDVISNGIVIKWYISNTIRLSNCRLDEISIVFFLDLENYNSSQRKLKDSKSVKNINALTIYVLLHKVRTCGRYYHLEYGRFITVKGNAVAAACGCRWPLTNLTSEQPHLLYSLVSVSERSNFNWPYNLLVGYIHHFIQ